MGFWGRKKQFVRIPIDRLRPGMHVSLAERWLDHPFMLNEFNLTSEHEIAIIRALGMTDVLWCAEASTAQPLPEEPAAPSAEALRDAAAQAEAAELRAKAKAEREARRALAVAARQRAARAEQAYLAATKELREAFAVVFAQPQAAMEKTSALVGEAAGAFNSEGEVSLMLLSERTAHASQYAHGVNVMLLSLLLGKTCGMDAVNLRDMAVGALYHDIGKLQIQDVVKQKTDGERSRAEETLFRLHVEYGENIIKRLPALGPAARAALSMHHERWDGSGYPRGLAGAAIPLAARIVALVNRYDNLCNPLRVKDALTPAEAIARLFRNETAHFEPTVLARFVKVMGVYPPGTVVELSNGGLGMVVSINHSDTLRPTLTLYAPDIPRDEAPVLDLKQESQTKIVRGVRPGELPTEVLEYLSTRSRMAYFYVAGADD